MAIITGAGVKFLEELPLGIHTLSEGTPDTIKLALFGPNANISPLTNAYTTSGEASGGGYTAGGVAVPLSVVGRAGSSRNSGAQFNNPYIHPTNDTTISIAGVGVRGCMLYNASQSNRNIFVLDFGTTVTPASQLSIPWALSRVTQFRQVLIPLLGRRI